MLKNRKVLVAVTASVAAYKSIELVRELRKREASVRVIMTPEATRFVTPLSLQVASGGDVIHDMFSHPMSHIELPQWGELMIVAPATANTIAKFASAGADDIVSACFLAFQGPVLLAPAMNWRMYTDTILQDKLRYLKDRGVSEIPPEEGNLACGEEGTGRMASLERVLSACMRILATRDLDGKKVVVTAGPTREYLDPVRFVSNRSSGKMGIALAHGALLRGAEVALIAGPVTAPIPAGLTAERVETSREMREAVKRNARGADIVIMAAAVADYAPRQTDSAKRAKQPTVTVELEATPDILNELSQMPDRPFLVGFAAETGDELSRAREKMNAKGMDMIVFNNVSRNDAGFDADTNAVVIIDRTKEEALPLMSKSDVAFAILDRISAHFPR